MNVEKLLLFVAISYYPLCAIVGFISFIKSYKEERYKEERNKE